MKQPQEGVGSLLRRADTLLKHRQAASAERLLRCAVEAHPDSSGAHGALGRALWQQNRHDEAIASLRQAVDLGQASAELHVSLAAALMGVGRLGEAQECLQTALVLAPGLAAAHARMGDLLAQLGRADESIASYRQATLLAPDRPDAFRNLAYTLNYTCAVSREEVLAAHAACAALEQRAHPAAGSHDNDPDPERRLKVGYVSGDFRQHSAAYFVEPLLEAHDREQVEVFCYSLAERSEEDAVTLRMKACVDRWTRASSYSIPALARRIARDRVDILVDLGGYTAGGCLGVFAAKPAPIQVSWLGYLNTTGLTTVDYRVTDSVADPVGDADPYYSEALARIRPPFLCYRPPLDAPPPAAPPFSTLGHVTFGCFNDLSKLSPEAIDTWAQLIRSVPRSRLVVKAQAMRDPPTVADLGRRLVAAGIPEERVDLLPWRVHVQHHLARYGLMDIALDPFPFNGVTTTCEALWMGVPVVTLAGDRHAGRIGATLLTALGLEDLVATTPEAYLLTARTLARDPARHTSLRTALRGRMERSLLCDGRDFARAMEREYRRMWRRWCGERSLPRVNAGRMSTPG